MAEGEAIASDREIAPLHPSDDCARHSGIRVVRSKRQDDGCSDALNNTALVLPQAPSLTLPRKRERGLPTLREISMTSAI